MTISYKFAALSIAMIFAAVTAATDAANMALELAKTNGEKIFIVLDKSPEISFPDENTVSISSADGTVVCDYDELESYCITGYSSISDIAVSGSTDTAIKIEAEQILISGLPDSVNAILYAIDGTLQASENSDADGICRISTVGLSRGAYLIIAGNFKCKIIL